MLRIVLLAGVLASASAALAEDASVLTRTLELGAGTRLDAPGSSLTLEAGLGAALSPAWGASVGLGVERAGGERGFGGLSTTGLYLTAGLDRALVPGWRIEATVTQVLAGDEEGLWDTDRETAVGAGLVWATDLGERSYFSVELVAEAERLSGARVLSMAFLVGFEL